MYENFRVDGWLVQPNLNQISRNGTRLRVEPKVMQVLVCLARQAGEPVSKESLLQEVWPDTFVTDDVLKRSISELRRVLQDDAHEPRIIETISKRGYRLLTPIQGANASQTAPICGARDLGRSRHLPRWAFASVAVVLLIALGALIGGVLHWRGNGHSSKDIRSLAVLPLQNLSHDPEQEYFADGITDELITDLAQITRLRVISRTSIMRYKATKEPITAIAQALGVDAIVEGTVERDGNQVRIRAQLIDAVRDQHLWARSYDRELLNILQLQDEVARDIAQEITSSLPSSGGGHMTQKSIDTEAYDEYLRGKYYAHRLNQDDVAKGVVYLGKAIQRDPTYAPAFAELGLAYLAMPNLGGPFDWIPAAEPFSKAKAAAEHALGLDPNLADAHAVLGTVYEDFDWDWERGEKELQLAIELNPNSSFAHMMNAFSLSYTGKSAASLQEMDRARALDPLSSTEGYASAFILLHARRYDQALQVAERAAREDPESPFAHLTLASALGAAGKGQQGFAEWLQYLQVSGNEELARQLAKAAQTAGGTGDPGPKLASITLRYLRKKSKTEYVSPAAFVEAYLEAGDNNHAFQWLEKGYQEHCPIMFSLKVDPMFDPIRADPRFQRLLLRMHFPTG